ncbi:hypothetical protein CSB37_03070 [bacterium DOLZORAL124_38_8]|nr:MAG: hypothetical protein CSB37_03070 [bacterium DOLZORAL124_38_8]
MKFLHSPLSKYQICTKFVWKELLETANLSKEYLKSNICNEAEKARQPLETALTFQEAAKNRTNLKEALESQKALDIWRQKSKNLENLIKNKLETKYAGFADRIIQEVEAMGLTGKKKMEVLNEKIKGVAETISLDPQINKSTRELFEFGETQTGLALGVLALRGLSPGAKVLSAKSFKMVLITTLISQPIVGKVGSEIVPYIKTTVGTFLEVLGRTMFAGSNGKFKEELLNSLDGGDPVEYLLTGRDRYERDKNKIKDPENLQDLQKIDRYLGHEFKDFYTAKNEYQTQPEKMTKQIPRLAEFCASTIKSNISPQELELAIRKMNNNEWDDEVIKKAFVMTHMGTVVQFMQYTASASDRDTFFDLVRKNLDDPKNEALNTAKINNYFPGLNAERMSNREKSQVLDFLKGGFSGLAVTAVVGSLLFGQLFSFIGNIFRATEWSSSGYKVLAKPFEWSKRLIDKTLLKPFSSLKEVFTTKKKAKAFDVVVKTLHKGNKKKKNPSILTKKETKKLLKLPKEQKIKAMETLQEQYNKKDFDITADEFWKMPGIKDVANDIRETATN